MNICGNRQVSIMELKRFIKHVKQFEDMVLGANPFGHCYSRGKPNVVDSPALVISRTATSLGVSAFINLIN